MKASAELRERIEACWLTAKAVEPARGAVTDEQLAAVQKAVDAAIAAHEPGIDGALGETRIELESALAVAIARAAAVAIAAGNDSLAQTWIADARRFSKSFEQRAELDAAKESLERYRRLVHARNRYAAGEVVVARDEWRKLLDEDGPADGIRKGAERDLEAPPAATWPQAELSRRDRILRNAAIVVGLIIFVAYIVVDQLRDPKRLARKRFDAAIAAKEAPEEALRRLDAELQGPDLDRVDTGRAEKAGAAVVRLTASFVPKPLTVANIDQVARVIARYQGLPAKARGGVALTAILHQLDDWSGELSAATDRAARLGVLRQAWTLADKERASRFEDRIIALRLEIADAEGADWPLEALAILLEEPRRAAATAKATEIVERIADHPSLLEDAAADVHAWIWARPEDDELRAKVEAQRALAFAARPAVEAEGVTHEQLEAMQRERPWDQRVAVALAANDLHGGNPDAAEARLRAFGSEGMLIRDARFLLAQIASARDQLDVADAIMTRLLESRLARFQAASAAFNEIVSDLEAQLGDKLDRGDVPEVLKDRIEGAADDDERQRIVGEWFNQQLEADATVTRRRDTYLAYSDVIPFTIAAGTIKLRRAQNLEGAERAAMLASAERAFLAIRTQAEGQPEFHLGLAEIYARLGKHEESEKELKAILDKKDAELTLEVANVYRSVGSTERAIEVATNAYDAFPSPAREKFASLLGTLHLDDSESERWYKKADQSNPYVRTALLEIEGRRFGRAGKEVECSKAFADAARAHLADAQMDPVGYNNAALAHQQRYACSGDRKALDEAVSGYDKSYRLQGDQPIVLSNLASALQHRGRLRVLARRVDTHALRPGNAAAAALIDHLLDSPERGKLLAELVADPDLRRARDLMRQFEVLSPNSFDGYVDQMEWALAIRDDKAANTVLARARQAKALDASEDRHHPEDDTQAADTDTGAPYEVGLARLDRIVADRAADARTRAVAHWFRSAHLLNRGLDESNAADITAARAALREAEMLWPSMADPMLMARAAIDEVALQQSDAEHWTTMRGEYTALGALSVLSTKSHPLAETIRRSPAWDEVRVLAQSERSRPEPSYLQLVELLADPDLTARAEPLRANDSMRAYIELRLLAAPDDKELAALLALLKGR